MRVREFGCGSATVSPLTRLWELRANESGALRALLNSGDRHPIKSAWLRSPPELMPHHLCRVAKAALGFLRRRNPGPCTNTRCDPGYRKRASAPRLNGVHERRFIIACTRAVLKSAATPPGSSLSRALDRGCRLKVHPQLCDHLGPLTGLNSGGALRAPSAAGTAAPQNICSRDGHTVFRGAKDDEYTSGKGDVHETSQLCPALSDAPQKILAPPPIPPIAP
jgi:hypothetical protein